MDLRVLGSRIKTLREKLGLKQRDVASALQISAQAVSKWERGENAPDIAILLDLSRLLGVSCDHLLGRGEQLDDTFDATVFCTGLNNFAKRSATMAPRDVATLANGVFHLITEAVVRHDGVPVKYVGDGFLGFFSGPNHARRALRAAQEAGALVASPDLVVALHSGDIFLGAVGHADYARPDIIGDAVNTAFLVLNWTSQQHAGRISVTETTVRLLDGAARFGKPHAALISSSKKSINVYFPMA